MPQIQQKLLLDLTGWSQSDLLGNVDAMAKLSKMKEMKPKALWREYGRKALTCYTVNDLKVECQIYGIAKIPTKKDDIVEALNKVFEEEAQKHGKRKAEAVDTEEGQPNKKQATEANTSAEGTAVPDTTTVTATVVESTDNGNAPKATDGTTVVLNFVMPANHVSRVVSVPAEFTFDKTMEGLLASIGFDFDHLYKAQLNDTTVMKGGDKGEKEGVTGDKKLSELGIQVGDDISVTYDLGEEWNFRVLVKDIKSEPSDKIEVIDSKGKPPLQYGGEEDDEEVNEQEMESEEEEEDEESDAYPSEESESDDG